LAARCFVQYRRRGGQRRAPLPDFYIGAHAATEGLALLTRDVSRFRTYFPTVQLIVPEGKNRRDRQRDPMNRGGMPAAFRSPFPVPRSPFPAELLRSYSSSQQSFRHPLSGFGLRHLCLPSSAFTSEKMVPARDPNAIRAHCLGLYSF